MFIIEKLALFYTNFCWHWELVNMRKWENLFCYVRKPTAIHSASQLLYIIVRLSSSSSSSSWKCASSFVSDSPSLSFSSQHVFYECFLKIYRRFIFRKSLFQCASIRKKYRSTLYHDFLWFPRSVYLWYQNSNVFTVDFHMMMAFKI